MWLFDEFAQGEQTIISLKRSLQSLTPLVDIILLPFAWPAAGVLWLLRRLNLQRLPLCRAMLIRVGVLPVRHHYYEPFVKPSDLTRPLSEIRTLPGIDWNLTGQLSLLTRFVFSQEIVDLIEQKRGPYDFRFGSGAFESGDAEYLYQMIRHQKPRRLIEIGSGNSTLMARAAITRNVSEQPGYACEHVCVEPYEFPWLEEAGISVIRKRVEDVDMSLFEQLESGDILFIDSSHVIRPQGDVVVEYLQILPALRPGVIVHVHDIFSPRDYPAEWITERLWLWNEQYMLEAFLTANDRWEVLGALNMLKNDHYDALIKVCPFLTPDRQPGSFYLRKLR